MLTRQHTSLQEFSCRASFRSNSTCFIPPKAYLGWAAFKTSTKFQVRDSVEGFLVLTFVICESPLNLLAVIKMPNSRLIVGISK